MRKKYFVLGRLEQPRQNNILLNRHDKPNEPTKKGSLSFVLFESPFTSVLTVSKGHPSLVSLVFTLRDEALESLGLTIEQASLFFTYSARHVKVCAHLSNLFVHDCSLALLPTSLFSLTNVLMNTIPYFESIGRNISMYSTIKICG